MNFKLLVNNIQKAHAALQLSAINAVNRHITMRNWLFGFYIVEFEQKGEDRARYGESLLEKLALRLGKLNLKGLTATELSRYRKFYLSYPAILGTVSQKLISWGVDSNIPVTVSQEFKSAAMLINKGAHARLPKQEKEHLKRLFAQTSFSHFVELIKIDDIYKRLYYEMLIIKTNPSVRELRRAIVTLAYERTGLSKNKKLSLQQIEQKIKPAKATDAIKDFYFFDFLNLPQTETVDENQLETALLNHLEKFILELGNGFCFEARQKRILIGDEYFFIDMVFYHRILHCHVLIDLKIDKFDPGYASQLKAYLSYYTKNIKSKNDNPPIGILMVTDKNKALVEYAGAGISDKMFVSKYAIELPSKKQLEDFIKRELRKL
jgi:predicted nuclease of restriction endonuclease-like (RecB) superfamily